MTAADLPDPMDMDSIANFESLGQDPLETLSETDDELNVSKSITKDSGVTKKILKVGSGWDTPQKGDEVYVTYIGRLVPDGEVFDQNVDSQRPFSFSLGKGMVIKGWDEGIKTMKKGEKALLTIQPEYAYGQSGSPPKIPPNATLEFEVELLSWKSVNALTPDGKVTLRKVHTDDAAWKVPKEGWEVVVNVKGTVVETDKAFVDESITFTLGTESQACFPPGGLISKAILKFKKGETGFVTVPSEYGYGEAGNASLGIPPLSTLRYDLELAEWHEVDTIAEHVVKKTLVEGSGWEKPKIGSIVEVSVSGRCIPSGTVVPVPISQVKHVTLGSGQLPEALDLAIEQMKKGEKALVTAPSDFGYGVAVTSQLALPSEEAFEFQVELVSFEKPKESWDMDTQEKMTEMGKHRELGNTLFKENKYRLAVKHYSHALKFFEHDSKSLSQDDRPKIDAMILSCHLNLAACHLKQRDYSQVIEHASKALKRDPHNLKALYRRAQAYLGRDDLESADKDCETGLETGDTTTKGDFTVLRRKVRQRMKEVDAKERTLFARMLSGGVGK